MEKKNIPLLNYLHQLAAQMSEVVTETWHLITLYILHHFEDIVDMICINGGATIGGACGVQILHQGLVVIDTDEYRSWKMCSHCKG